MSRSTVSEPDFILQLVSLGVFGNGIIMLASTLRIQLFDRLAHVDTLFISLPLLIGLTLIYLATLLRRRKRAAWFVVLPVYAFSLGLNLAELLEQLLQHRVEPLGVIRNLILPVIVVCGLWLCRKEFTVKSDIRSFTLSLKLIGLIFLVVFVYGIVGFRLLERRDFHTQVSWTSAIHHTLDQFDFTTNSALTPYTKRAHLFIDSLNIISAGAVLYALASLFQPLKAKFTEQGHLRETADKLLQEYGGGSEDFFKLWPHDKTYYFSSSHQAGLAYRVERGVALVVGDPFGNQKQFKPLLSNFLEFCRVNDWLPAFIHTEPKHNDLYRQFEFSIQKIGEEAIVNLARLEEIASNKYFRQIGNKFKKQEYTAELLQPPHNAAIITRLRDISKDWLELPGRTERSFMMGYFSENYLQQCEIMVLRDAAGTIQAFLNHVPDIDPKEINYDLLRHAKGSLGNSNDYLLLKFAEVARERGYERLNLGLCPLAGLMHPDEEETLINSTLRFVYANGDRFYSFSGLERFKAKYQPDWQSRYIVYKNGIRGFTRTLTALNKAMGHTKHQ